MLEISDLGSTIYLCNENKGADTRHLADLRLCFRICKKQVFSWCGSNAFVCIYNSFKVLTVLLHSLF